MRVGYRRVSSIDQDYHRQELGELDKLFQEKESGGSADRQALQDMIAYVRAGDEVVVYSIDRLARNLRDLQTIIQELNDKKVSISFLSERLTFTADSNDAFAKLQLQMLGAFSEYERNIIRIRQAEGIKKAKARGVYSGRKKINPEKIRELHASGVTPTMIAQRMGCSRQSVYRSLT